MADPKPPDLKRAALAYLARYASSSAHLRRILERRLHRWSRVTGADKAPHLPLVDAALAACASAGLLDDAAFARDRAGVLRRRGWATRRIQAALAGKGIARPQIELALANPEVEEEAAARRYAERRRLGPWRLAGRAERRQRDIAAMARAGFAPGLARRIVDGEP